MSDDLSPIDWQYDKTDTAVTTAAEPATPHTELSASAETPIVRRPESDGDRCVGHPDSASFVWTSQMTTNSETNDHADPEAKPCVGQRAIGSSPQSGGDGVESRRSRHTVTSGAETTVKTRTQTMLSAQAELSVQTEPRVGSETGATPTTVSEGLV